MEGLTGGGVVVVLAEDEAVGAAAAAAVGPAFFGETPAFGFDRQLVRDKDRLASLAERTCDLRADCGMMLAADKGEWTASLLTTGGGFPVSPLGVSSAAFTGE